MSSDETSMNTNAISGGTSDNSSDFGHNGCIVIGIAGGTGSGKTTIAKKLKESYSHEFVQLIAQDSYYRDRSDLSIEERRKINYDSPEAYDNELLISHIDALRSGQAIYQPTYSFVEHNRCKEVVLVKPARILILEGILALNDENLRKRMDVKLFVQTDADIRFIRRLRRDIKDRGRTMEEVIQQYRNTVKPMHMLHVEPTKRYADIIIPEGGKNAVAIGMIRAWIDQVIERSQLKQPGNVTFFGSEDNN